jgi:hypothetical protein
MVQVQRITSLGRFAEQNRFPMAYFAPIVMTNAAPDRQFLQRELSKIIFVRLGRRDEIPTYPVKGNVRQAWRIAAPVLGKPELL